MSICNVIKSELADIQKLSPSGFAMAFQIQLTTPGYLFQTYSDEWISYYSENGLVLTDPTVHWGFENDGIIKWSELRESDSNNMLSKAAEFGLGFGVAWATGTGDSRSICSFARDDREFDEAEIVQLVRSAQEIHDKTLDRAPLTKECVSELQANGILVSQSATG